MLYIFAGYPKTRLNAGGLQYAVEERLGIALLEHAKGIHYRKEGVFSGNNEEAEWLYPVEYRLSDLCLHDGITWDWFPENWAFGNGVTVHKTLASPEYRTVVHGTDLTLDEYVKYLDGDRWVSEQRQREGVQVRPPRVKLADIELERSHIRTEGWEKYEKRWLPGTCPQENHIVHLTWLVTKHRLPEFAYERIRHLIEVPGEAVDESLYESRHFSATRLWDGASAFHQGAPALEGMR